MSQFELDLTASPLGSASECLQLLTSWRRVDAIRPLDLAFASQLAQMCEAAKLRIEPITVLLSAIASQHLSDGHVCIDLRKMFERPERFINIAPASSQHLVAEQAPINLRQLLASTSLSQCLKSLESCCAVSTSAQNMAPLALKGTRLYLSRYYHYELKIAQGIRARLPTPSDINAFSHDCAGALKQAIDVLFEQKDRLYAASQMHACALAARSRFAIITGGPGTGKTTTVVKLLAALQSIAGSVTASDGAGKKLNIALAAPTGKAAARLNQSISSSVKRLPLAQLPGHVGVNDIPQKVSTLHRILGSRGASQGFTYNKHNPLAIDVLVIDEASMVDVSMMAAVIEALKPDARLILLGDKDQLASVDAGAVLGQLAEGAHLNNYSKDTSNYLEAMTGVPALVQSDAQAPNDQASKVSTNKTLAQNVAMLNHSFRFDANSGIGQLAKMVNRGALDSRLLDDLNNKRLADALSLQSDFSKEDGAGIQAFVDHIKDGSPRMFANEGKGRMQNNQHIEPPVGYGAYLSLLDAAQSELRPDSSDEQWDALAQKVLDCFQRFQVLSAMRNGPYGVEALNIMMQKALIPAAKLAAQGSFYEGRPLLVTRNDYNLGLTNGDVGMVIWRYVTNKQGKSERVARVAFESEQDDGKIRWFSPSRLLEVETVFAMTVHKSQGSEFEHACFVLPERVNPVVSKELVYTAITRAKYWISIVSPNDRIFKDAIKNPINRESGLEIDD
ncbi:exodeoxyribonuclease V subunit alpha [Glaciecola siphonariae]|uniref:RecBCD enzyme subunit RecD n=1 Tax=Glaciecola siphonariae TaxID=521012 RepID=A0ABV9LVV3_9ALTE